MEGSHRRPLCGYCELVRSQWLTAVSVCVHTLFNGGTEEFVFFLSPCTAVSGLCGVFVTVHGGNGQW